MGPVYSQVSSQDKQEGPIQRGAVMTESGWSDVGPRARNVSASRNGKRQ